MPPPDPDTVFEDRGKMSRPPTPDFSPSYSDGEDEEAYSSSTQTSKEKDDGWLQFSAADMKKLLSTVDSAPEERKGRGKGWWEWLFGWWR